MTDGEICGGTESPKDKVPETLLCFVRLDKSNYAQLPCGGPEELNIISREFGGMTFEEDEEGNRRYTY